MKKYLSKISLLLCFTTTLLFSSCSVEDGDIDSNIIATTETSPNDSNALTVTENISFYNSSFELGTEGWDITEGTYIVEIDSTTSYSGINSLKIKANNTSLGYAVPFIKTPVFQDLKSNSTYKLSFWMYSQANIPESISLHYYFLGGSNNTNINESPTDWTEYTTIFSTSTSTDLPKFVFSPNLAVTTFDNFSKPLAEDNTIWLDNITIMEID